MAINFDKPKRERLNTIIPVIYDKERHIYAIEMTEEIFASVQELLIKGGLLVNIGIFFSLESK